MNFIEFCTKRSSFNSFCRWIFIQFKRQKIETRKYGKFVFQEKRCSSKRTVWICDFVWKHFKIISQFTSSDFGIPSRIALFTRIYVLYHLFLSNKHCTVQSAPHRFASSSSYSFQSECFRREYRFRFYFTVNDPLRRFVFLYLHTFCAHMRRRQKTKPEQTES